MAAPRVLHLLARRPDYQSQAAVSQLTRGPGSDTRIVTVGHGGDFANPWIGVVRLRQMKDPFDVIHAWGMDALTTAVLGSNRPIVFSPSRFPNSSELRWQRAIIGVRDVQLICTTDTMRRHYVQRGVPIERCHMIRPGVEFALVNRKRNDALRLKLGFGPEAFVLLACGEHVRGANHNATILCATTLNLYNPKYKILLWGRGELDHLTRRFASLMLPRNFIRFATDRLGKQVMFEDLLPAADTMLITADGPLPTLPIAVAMAAGMPTVAVVSPTVSELLEDRHTAFMLKETRGRLVARRVLDLEDHGEERWKMSDTARTEAYEYFSMTRFVNQMSAVYEQIAQGKQVEVIQPAPGAGARFAGRG